LQIVGNGDGAHAGGHEHRFGGQAVQFRFGRRYVDARKVYLFVFQAFEAFLRADAGIGDGDVVLFPVLLECFVVERQRQGGSGGGDDRLAACGGIPG
jgi:hypothetical protein